ncbi:hypothetical protein [Hydrogenovibrio sp. JE_KL2]|uniref:beta family protein n=1 Tax=Hydrogenovibrio sp. JE_KL2 TaxID=2651188 RepID=UPI00128BAE73|nr:hypothetical protein [Hydrogenovibrio sp. JE_KL2]MPQ76820.1 hypothetical protein [Hydrogenovibrio sp. JE_KL2]
MKYEDYCYFPKIRTRQAELLGFEQLEEGTRASILPLFSVTTLGQRKTVSSVLDGVKEKFFERLDYFLLEFESNKHVKCEDLDYYLSEENNFEKWVSLHKEIDAKSNLIPGLIPASFINNRRQYVKHIQTMEENFDHFFIKIDPMRKRDVTAAVTVASICNKLENKLFIIDVGQIDKSRISVIEQAIIFVINEIREIDSSINIVVQGSSFPRSFADYGREAGTIPMLEWDLFSRLGGTEVCFYGDYASIHGEFYEGSYASFVARVDLPAEKMWVFERRTAPDQENINREQLYISAAKAIKENDFWDPELDCWGKKIVDVVASGRVEGFKSPAKWISVRLNLHIERMRQYIEAGLLDGGSSINTDDEFLDEVDDDAW